MPRSRALPTLWVAAAAVLGLVLGAAAPASASPLPPVSGAISGTVTSAGGGPLTQPVVVSARQGSYNANWIAYADAATGEYTIDGLPAGTYLVYFMPVVTNVFDPQYREQLYDGAYTEQAATRLTVSRDRQAFTSIDAVMEYETSGTPVDPVDAVPCITTLDAASVRLLARQFAAAGGAVGSLSRSDIARYIARCR